MRLQLNLFILAISFTLWSCEKQLDIPPQRDIEADDALRSSSDVEAALIGAYSDLGADGIFSGTMYVQQEILANTNDFSWEGTYAGLTAFNARTVATDNIFVTDTWADAYGVINDVNNVLSAVDIVIETRRNQVEGEAKFVRGLVYFELLRNFAKDWSDGNPAQNDGVPLVLEPTEGSLDSSDFPSRAKVSQVYDQVISDLTQAESLLVSEESTRANKAAASSLLARVYLQKADYANALAAAQRALDEASDAGYELTSNYADAFPFDEVNLTANIPNTREDIFAIQVSNQDGQNDFNTYFSPFGRGDIIINQNHLDLYDPQDQRANLFYSSGGALFTGKFDMVYGVVHIIRLAEVYLIAAESAFRQGDPSASAGFLNPIRERAGLDPISAANITLNAILLERRLELAFEGHRLQDVRRLGLNVGSFPAYADEFTLPIPQRERIVNPKLTQNDGY